MLQAQGQAAGLLTASLSATNTDYAPQRIKGEPASVITPVSLRTLAESSSLLDNGGQFAREIVPGEMLAWKRELHNATSSRERQALLHIWMGEYRLVRSESPAEARWHFARARDLVSRRHAVYGLASFDTALTYLHQCDYVRARRSFRALLTARPSLTGFSPRNCALLMRFAGTAVGSRKEQEKQGIPQPPRLDPLCGAAALAACLRSLDLPYDKAGVLASCRVTGLGSSSEDLLVACRKQGLEGGLFTATEKGLRLLPKPLIAFVQHDHFVAVTEADDKGVTYLCSDCGKWPGGEVRLTWKQAPT